jgi:hypothetical protein
MKIRCTTTILVEIYTNHGTSKQVRRIMTRQMLPGSKGAVFVGEFDFE